ncbi:MAG: GNAT family N-acetyltransferase [Planctomycetota bacterium]
MPVRPLTSADRDRWVELRGKLWPSQDVGEYATTSFVDGLGERQAVFVAEAGDTIVGFVEVSLRPHAEGCRTKPVGYLEGWYVEKAHRSSGLGRELIAAAEDWARTAGCSEMASDCVEGNAIGLVAHEHLGYRPTVKCVLLRKSL